MAGDARPAGGGWTLRAICLLGAAAMAAAGAYLFEPGLADLGLYVERGKYALAGYTLIYAALLVGFASTAGALRAGNALANSVLSSVAGPIALIALGVLFAALAADAGFYRDPPNFWVALLAVPAALCFAAASLSQVGGKQEEERAGRNDGSVAPRGVLAGFLIVFLTFVAALAAVVIYVNGGYLLFYLLQANLLEGSDIDLARIGPALVAVMGAVVAERWQFVLIMGTLGAVLIYGFTALISWAGRAWPRGEQRLELQDEAFVSRCAQDLRAYAEVKGYARDAKRILGLVVLPSLFVPMFLVLLAGFNLPNWFPRPYDPAELDAVGWHIYERFAGPSLIAMLLAALFWSVFPNAILARISRSYSEMAGWSGFASNRSFISLEAYLRSLFRAGKLSPKVTFDPGRMLHHLNTAWEPFVMYPAVAATFVAAIAWHHDMSRYHVLTDSYVEVMSYWTLERKRYPYEAVRDVELGCRIDNGRPAASYEIALPDGFSVSLFDKKDLADHVTDLGHVDGLIPPRVPRRFVMSEGQNGYDPVCVEALAASLTEEDAGRLRAALRTETWHRARWRARIKRGPVKQGM